MNRIKTLTAHTFPDSPGLTNGTHPDACVQAVGADARVAGLSSEKQALLEMKLKALAEAKRKKQALASDMQPIPRRSDRVAAPLSFAQELLWLVDQMRPDSFVYNVPRALKLEGPLDVEALRRAVEAMIGRHEVLRTSIAAGDGEPMQVIAPPPRVELPLVDLSGLPALSRVAEADRLIREAALYPFNLARDLMLRATLIRLGTDEHIFIINLHHIVSDGFSKGIMFRELSAFYGAFAGGDAPRLDELPIQYADYAAWQRGRVRGEVYDKLLAYWKGKLAGAPAMLELPTDRPRPPVKSFRGSFRRRDLPAELLGGLKELSRERKATLFMTLLAAYKAFLSRYTGQEDIVLGTPIANRDRTEVAGLMGFFINTLVLRTDLSGDPTFRELIDRVRRTALDAYDHQEMPFERLVMELKPERDLSYTPVIQALFSVGHVQGGHVQDLVPELPGLTLTRLPLDRGSAKFDYTIGITEGPDWLLLGCEYDTDLFDPETVDRMLEHFEILLRAAVADPDRRISELPLLSDEERRRVVVEWNDTRREVPRGASVPRSFEAQSARTPEAIALVAGERQFTYRELNARANRLAHALKRRGVGPDVPVGICTGRSPEVAVAILGTLKAGGICFPLDPAYPRGRLASMVDDSHAPILLTLEHLLPILPEHSAEVIRLDADWAAIAEEPDGNLAEGPGPDQAAYLIYTSGSTGKSKGVVLTHRGLINHTLASIDLYGLTAADRVLQFASLSFDISVEELLPSWCAGAAVVLRPEGPALADLSFSRLVGRERITVLDLPTAFWQEWVNELAARGASAPSTLRLVIVGGEKASALARSTWLERGGRDVRWVNTYGPTEATVIATAYEPPRDSPGPDDADPPIGRPIANTRVYILDPRRRPVPAGVPGELYIGGDGLARGYLNRDDLTAEKFVPDPFGGAPGARLYRTGDRARWRPDGLVEFLGRVDDQVKIRGFRVEPGEVEESLTRLPGIRQAAVVVREDAPGAKRLVAYVVADSDPAPTPGELRQGLGSTLPEYMIPSTFVAMAALPMTPNGKVDRRALPAPAAAGSDLEPGFVPPRSPAEVRLAAIWAEVLGLERVGVRDDFFELGGHSLLVLRLWSRIEAEFGQVHPINLIYQARTVEGLAAVLAPEAPPDSDASHLAAMPGADDARPLLFCLDFAALLASYLDDVAIYPLEYHEQDIEDCDSVEEMAAAYNRRMRMHQKEGPYRICGFCGMGLVAFEMARQLRRDGQEVSLLALVDPKYVGPPRRAPGLSPSYFKRRLRYHTSALAGVPARSWPRYFAAKLFSMVHLIGVEIGAATPRRFQAENDWWATRQRLKNILASYRPGFYPGRVTLLLASEKVARAGDTELGWSRLAGEGLSVSIIPGDHATIAREPGVRTLVRELRAGVLGAD